MALRVMTWNVHGALGLDRRRDPERLARVLDEVRPDLVGLQEVGWPGGSPDPASALGGLTGLHAAFGPTHLRHGWAFGNAILSRHPIEATRSYDLSMHGREPRGCLRADVALGDTAVHLFACHLGLDWHERRRQAAQLLSADILRDAALAYPLVLVGDFNVWSNRSAVPRWLRRQLTDCAAAAGPERPTFPSAFPLLRLDRAYVGAAFRVTGCRVHASPLARRASDHLPVVVDLELQAAARRPPAARPITASGVATTFGAR